jgi:hypothetical protein
LEELCRDLTSSLPPLTTNSTVIVIFVYLFSRVNIGRKFERAEVLKNYISKKPIPFTADDLFWDYFERLLLWIRGHTSPRSFLRVLQPYED